MPSTHTPVVHGVVAVHDAPSPPVPFVPSAPPSLPGVVVPLLGSSPTHATRERRTEPTKLATAKRPLISVLISWVKRIQLSGGGGASSPEDWPPKSTYVHDAPASDVSS